MALTISHVDECKFVNGNKRERVVDVTFDSSYPTDGESLVASDLGLNKIFHISGGIAMKTDESDGVVVGYDYTAEKLVAFWGNNDAASDSGLIEVANTTDLSAYSIRLRVLGR